MPDTMEVLRQEAVNRPEEEKAVIAYMLSGNSVFDIMNMLVEYMQLSKDGWNDYVDELKAECQEFDAEQGNVSGENTTWKQYLKSYDDFIHDGHINSPHLG